MSEYFGGVRILRKSPNTSERPNTSEEPNTSDGTEYFGLKRFFNLLISHGTEVFANTSDWPNTSDPNTSESEYFGFYYSATIRPIPSNYLLPSVSGKNMAKIPPKMRMNMWNKMTSNLCLLIYLSVILPPWMSLVSQWEWYRRAAETLSLQSWQLLMPDQQQCSLIKNQ